MSENFPHSSWCECCGVHSINNDKVNMKTLDNKWYCFRCYLKMVEVKLAEDKLSRITAKSDNGQIDEKELAVELESFFFYALSHGAPYRIDDVIKWSTYRAKSIFKEFGTSPRRVISEEKIIWLMKEHLSKKCDVDALTLDVNIVYSDLVKMAEAIHAAMEEGE